MGQDNAKPREPKLGEDAARKGRAMFTTLMEHRKREASQQAANSPLAALAYEFQYNSDGDDPGGGIGAGAPAIHDDSLGLPRTLGQPLPTATVAGPRPVPAPTPPAPVPLSGDGADSPSEARPAHLLRGDGPDAAAARLHKPVIGSPLARGARFSSAERDVPPPAPLSLDGGAASVSKAMDIPGAGEGRAGAVASPGFGPSAAPPSIPPASPLSAPLGLDRRGSRSSFGSGGGGDGLRPRSSSASSMPDVDDPTLREFWRRYDWHEPLGMGGYSFVMHCVDRSSGQHVAVKCVPRPAKEDDPDFEEQIDREVELQRVCEHKHVVRIHDYVKAKTMLLIVMDLCEGDLLHTICAENECHSYSEKACAGIVAAICQALEHLHDNDIAHLDIKPGNVLLMRKQPRGASSAAAGFSGSLPSGGGDTPISSATSDSGSGIYGNGGGSGDGDSASAGGYDSAGGSSGRRAGGSASATGGSGRGLGSPGARRGSSGVEVGSSSPTMSPIRTRKPSQGSPKFDPRDPGNYVRIADFGMADRVPVRRSMGTPLFVAPEILLHGVAGPPADMWSLGVLTYILLCGFPPFMSRNADGVKEAVKRGKIHFYSPYWDSVSQAAKDLVSSMLQRDPVARISAKDALRHPWITHAAPRSALPRTVSMHMRKKSMRRSGSVFGRKKRRSKRNLKAPKGEGKPKATGKGVSKGISGAAAAGAGGSESPRAKLQRGGAKLIAIQRMMSLGRVKDAASAAAASARLHVLERKSTAAGMIRRVSSGQIRRSSDPPTAATAVAATATATATVSATAASSQSRASHRDAGDAGRAGRDAHGARPGGRPTPHAAPTPSPSPSSSPPSASSPSPSPTGSASLAQLHPDEWVHTSDESSFDGDAEEAGIELDELM